MRRAGWPTFEGMGCLYHFPIETVGTPGRCKVVLPHIRVDDWVFGVSSVSTDGFESPVASAVPGGAFHPYIAPAKK